ncbi:hypothetical protein MTBLM1_60251 [Rhodospirillaceae bacterium LM-1]|nr:hypothetical protein MTBLM1_60251 [Rhodospirillaceae bacterium LM-1]
MNGTTTHIPLPYNDNLFYAS